MILTVNGFRRIALGLEGVVESAHHGHPDFRVGGRIFATLGYPDLHHGCIMLTPEQQKVCVQGQPAALAPAAGKWGEQGSTTVRLDAVNDEGLGEVLTLAWQNAVAKRPTRTSGKSRGSKRRKKARVR